MDRRTTIKWVLAASAAVSLLERHADADSSVPRAGYGHDPDLLKDYKPGDLWPLTLTWGQRAMAKTLSDLIIPADDHSPSASAVGVVDFLDEWMSAPYPQQRADREQILEGFHWLDEESHRRFGRAFLEITDTARHEICDDICDPRSAGSRYTWAAGFFARYRDLTAAGFYTTPQGTKDLGYVGNTPLKTFDGPPVAVLKQVGLA